MASTTPRKRPLAEDDRTEPLGTPRADVTRLQASPTPNAVIDRAASPSLSSTLSTLTSLADDQQTNLTPSKALNEPGPAKRRKLTPAEKEQQRLEKEAKTQQRAEQKARRDEEKRVEEQAKQKKREEREEERRIEEQEKQKKREEREVKKRQKELESLQKQQEKDRAKQEEDEAKQKKERSQLRLNAFFAQPKSLKPGNDTNGSAAGLSASRDNSPNGKSNLTAVQCSPTKPQLDWDKVFLPFCLPQSAKLAPQNAFSVSSEVASQRIKALETEITDDTNVPLNSIQLVALFASSESGGTKHQSYLSAEELVGRIHGSTSQPIDLTTDEEAFVHEEPLQLLQRLPLKYIHFEQDVRPPYYGTFTKLKSAHHASKLGRAPTSRSIAEFNYDYDSEAEWEEPEEGEDIGSEGEEDADSNEGDDDMEGFLDDEDDVLRAKRGLMATEMEPISSGLCWEDAQRKIRGGGSQNSHAIPREFKLGILLDPQPQSIDPYSTSYWHPEPVSVNTANASHDSTPNTRAGLMQPPVRVPLQVRPNSGNVKVMEEFTGKAAKSVAAAPKPAKRMIPDDRMDEFKQAVEGSDMTKLALIEALKKQFPALPKDAISNTLSSIAARIGAREVEKRWVVLK